MVYSFIQDIDPNKQTNFIWLLEKIIVDIINLQLLLLQKF